MLRIDPAHPPLWRSVDQLQFGLDSVAVVGDPTPWQQRLLRELERGIPEDAAASFAIAAGASPLAAQEFLAEIDGALLKEGRPRPSTRIQAAGDVPAEQLDVVGRALSAGGCHVETAHAFDRPGGAMTDATTLVILAHGLVPPAFVGSLMADDIPHLPIVIAPDRAEIGPRVVPGRTACLSCRAAHRRDADPAWPTIAVQLLGRRAPDVEEAVLWEAGIVAARMLSSTERGDHRWAERSLTLHSDSLQRTARTNRPHADCRCRSLAGSGTAGVPEHLEPTRPRAYAQPA